MRFNNQPSFAIEKGVDNSLVLYEFEVFLTTESAENAEQEKERT